MTTNEPSPSTNPTRIWGKKARRSPYHSNTVRRVLRIGQMAWEGRSAGEIADEIGVGTQYVYQLCTDYRIGLAKKTKAEYAFRVTLKLRTIACFEKLALERDEPVNDIVARLMDALSREPIIVKNLLEEDEPP